MVRADSRVRAYETVEVKRIGDIVILANFEHFTGGGFKTGFMISRNGREFSAAPDHYMEDHLCRGWEVAIDGLQIVFIPDADGVHRHIGISHTIDKQRHYNLAIYPICPLIPGCSSYCQE